MSPKDDIAARTAESVAAVDYVISEADVVHAYTAILGPRPWMIDCVTLCGLGCGWWQSTSPTFWAETPWGRRCKRCARILAARPPLAGPDPTPYPLSPTPSTHGSPS